MSMMYCALKGELVQFRAYASPRSVKSQDSRPRAEPTLALQSRKAGEISKGAGHQHQVVGHGYGGDLGIDKGKGQADFFLGRLRVRMNPRGVLVVGQDGEARLDHVEEEGAKAILAPARRKSRDPVVQFVPDERWHSQTSLVASESR
jgi:hypothetical protein